MINPYNNNINQMMINKFNNDLTQYYLYQQRLMQMQKQQQMIQTFKIQQQYLMMQAYMNNFKMNFNNNNNNNNNYNNINNNNNNNQNKVNENKFGIKIKFLIVPKDWDKSENSISIIMVQITLEHTLEKTINTFFSKFELPRESIAEFKFNDNTLDVKSKQKLSEIGIAHESKILAIKADNYDTFTKNQVNK